MGILKLAKSRSTSKTFEKSFRPKRADRALSSLASQPIIFVSKKARAFLLCAAANHKDGAKNNQDRHEPQQIARNRDGTLKFTPLTHWNSPSIEIVCCGVSRNRIQQLLRAFFF
jgi:hypothetical protein